MKLKHRTCTNVHTTTILFKERYKSEVSFVPSTKVLIVHRISELRN